MADLGPFPDLEKAVQVLVADLATGGTGTTTPSDLAEKLPFVRMLAFGGSDDRFTDMARIDIYAFESTRPLARALAANIQALFLNFPHVVSGETTTVIDKIETLTRPQEIPWGNPAVRLFTASYEVSARR